VYIIALTPGCVLLTGCGKSLMSKWSTIAYQQLPAAADDQEVAADADAECARE
jgi:hypothetical protein